MASLLSNDPEELRLAIVERIVRVVLKAHGVDTLPRMISPESFGHHVRRLARMEGCSTDLVVDELVLAARSRSELIAYFGGSDRPVPVPERHLFFA